MRRNAVETIMGAVVLAVAAFFLVFAYTRAQVAYVKGYVLVAKFDRIDGIEDGSDVRLSGIKVGTVLSQSLDPDTYLAVLRISIDPRIELPADTVAKVTSDGLLGGKYLALDPGGEEQTLKPGDEIVYTQSAISIEDLIGRYIFSSEPKGTAQGSGSETVAP
jgi:phospholipid/cholesterol/gamma-HCH transport system substrate-binding protein